MDIPPGDLKDHYDPHRRSWMLFVDGENFTHRAQKLAKERGITLTPGKYYQPDIFIWFPFSKPSWPMIVEEGVKLQSSATRCHYYTSVFGDQDLLDSTKQKLWNLGFAPEVFKKSKKEEKAKGVDIALTKDLLSHAFRNNFEAAVLIAGDGDYVPLIEEVKRLGKVIYLGFFSGFGLNRKLSIACDSFFEMEGNFIKEWKEIEG